MTYFFTYFFFSVKITVNLIFKIIMVAVFYPSYLLILRSMLACARLTYLTNGSIPKFFASPFTYIGFLVMVVMAGLLILSEQQLVVAGYENRHQSKQSLTHIARRGFAGTKHFLNVKKELLLQECPLLMSIFTNWECFIKSINHSGY